MLPGFRRTQWAPASIAFSARVWLKWMSAITGIGERFDDRLQRLDVLLARDGDAHDVGARVGHAADLIHRRLEVGRLGLRHRLHDDGRSAADRHVASIDIWRFEATRQGYLGCLAGGCSEPFLGAIRITHGANEEHTHKDVPEATWLAAMLLALGAAAPARADHHLIMVREVHRGATAAGDYVMLQMFADGQNMALNTHYIDILGTDGQAGAEYPLPTGMVGQNQRTILIGNTGVSGADFSNAGVALPTNGAVCYDGDQWLQRHRRSRLCGLGLIHWNHPSSFFPGSAGLHSRSVGLAPGQSLVRTITRGCATLLDTADDTNSSAADFALGPAIGRNNAATPIVQKPCPTGSAGTGAPQHSKNQEAPEEQIRRHLPHIQVQGDRGGLDSLQVQARPEEVPQVQVAEDLPRARRRQAHLQGRSD